jgi:hypothetical protein
MSDDSTNSPHSPTANAGGTSGDTSTAEPLRCALTGEVISPEEAYWAPPLVTVEQLFDTIRSTLKENPGHLPQVLFAEQPDVPYSPQARDQLGDLRSKEQLKLMGVLLLVLLVIGLIVWLIF